MKSGRDDGFEGDGEGDEDNTTVSGGLPLSIYGGSHHPCGRSDVSVLAVYAVAAEDVANAALGTCA